MKMKWAAAAVVVGVAAVAALTTRAEEAKKKEGPAVVHNVFFSLKDNSDGAKKKLIASCKKHLTKHPGEVYFAAGPIASEFKREVNDTDFDVALTIVFKDKASHDVYQDAKRHLEFISEGKDNWKKVRVFDSYGD